MTDIDKQIELHGRVMDLTCQLFERARQLDSQLTKNLGYDTQESVSTCIGGLQYHIAALASSLGEGNFATDFLLERLEKDIERMGMEEVQQKMIGKTDVTSD